MRTDATHRELAPLVDAARRLGPDELRVLTLLAERLRSGEATYGALHLAADARDFKREALEEVADALFYAACALVRR